MRKNSLSTTFTTSPPVTPLRIEHLSEKASKEYQLEKMLKIMQVEWEDQLLETQVWKTSNVKILSGQVLEDIQTLLDEHIIKAQTIRSNPSIA